MSTTRHASRLDGLAFSPAALARSCMALMLMTVAVTWGDALSAQAPSAANRLNLGDQAPALQVEHWLTDGYGQLGPVEELQEGEVYLIEFWATWCESCRESFTHLRDLQLRHREERFTVISVSDETPERVRKFLRSPLNKQAQVSFGQIAQVYCVASDPDRSVWRDYMQATGKEKIPTAFLIGRDGRLKWIGHPLEAAEPLAELLQE